MQFQSFCFFWFTFLFELRHEMVCNLLIQGFKGLWPNTTTISPCLLNTCSAFHKNLYLERNSEESNVFKFSQFSNIRNDQINCMLFKREDQVASGNQVRSEILPIDGQQAAIKVFFFLIDFQTFTSQQSQQIFFSS